MFGRVLTPRARGVSFDVHYIAFLVGSLQRKVKVLHKGSRTLWQLGETIRVSVRDARTVKILVQPTLLGPPGGGDAAGSFLSPAGSLAENRISGAQKNSGEAHRSPWTLMRVNWGAVDGSQLSDGRCMMPVSLLAPSVQIRMSASG